jgi:hypothetical protein
VSAADLLARLARLQALTFTARSASATGWTGSATGVVVVQIPLPGVVILNESGTWRPERGPEQRFHNVFRWSLLEPALVRLEHLRFGVDRPVWLFDLAPATEGLWLPAGPHVCREDCYTAELRLADGGLSLDWTITGPRKQERIEYRYRE